MKERLAAINASRWFLYANVLIAFVLVNVAATRLNCRADLSRGNVNSLTASTEKVLERLDQPVLVEAYITQNVPGFILSRVNAIITQLKEIDRVGGDKVQFRLINPEDPEDQQRAEARGIQGIEIEEARVDSASVRKGYFGVYIQMGDQSKVLFLVDQGDLVSDLEYRFLREIKGMLRDRGPGGIGLVQAPGATEARPWNPRTQTLDKDNIYGFKRLIEQDLGGVQEVRLDARVPFAVKTLLLVGLPRLEPKEVYHLDQFLMRGGSLVCMLKGFDFQLQQQDPRMARFGLGGPGGGFASVPEEELRDLNDWLGHYGITVNGEILLEPEAAVAARDIQGQFVVKVANPAWAFYDRSNDNIVGSNPAVAPIEQLVLPWFSGLDVKEALQPEVNFSVLLQSNPGAISRTSSNLDLRQLQELGRSDQAVGRQVPLAVFAEGQFKSRFRQGELPEEVDPAGFVPAQTGQTRSSLTVIGTPYMVSDMLLQSETNLQIFEINRAFLANLLELSGGDRDLLEARSRVKPISYLDNLALLFGPSIGGLLELLFMWFHILFVPVALAIYGTIHLVGRNRRRGLETARVAADGGTAE